MRRPITAWLVSFAAGIFTGRYFEFPVIFAAAAILFLACAVLSRRGKTICLLLVLFVLGAADLELADSLKSPLAGFTGKTITVRGQVISLEQKEYGYRMVIKGIEWEAGGEGGKLKEKLLLNGAGHMEQAEKGAGVILENPQSLVGKEIVLTGTVSLPSGQRNPGLFDYRLYLKTRGIDHILTGPAYQMTVTRTLSPGAEKIAMLKYRFSAALDKTMGEEAKSLLLGMLFGDKTLLSEDLYETFRRNGTAHILAVSGIHVGVVYLFVCRLFRNKRSTIASAAGMGLLLFYAALAAFSPSVVRAVLMIGIHVLSRHLHRRYDLLCCTAFSAVLLLMLHPYNLFHLGFQLSYLAVFTLAFVLPFVDSKLAAFSRGRENRRGNLLLKREVLFSGGNALLRLFVPAAAMQLSLMPVTAYYFQYLSFSAFFVNVPVIALAGAIIPLGIVLIPASLMGGWLFDFAATGAELLLKAMAILNDAAGRWDFSSVNVVSPNGQTVFFYYGLIFFLSSERFWDFYRKRRLDRAAALLAAWLFASALLFAVMGGNSFRADVVFVDVGQGDCIHIRTPSGRNVVIDGGGAAGYDVGKKILLPYFLKNGVSRIDLALVTHLHDDHYGGIASLCRLMPVKRLGLYSSNRDRQEQILRETGLPSRALVYLSKGDRIRVDSQVLIEILYPPVPAGKTAGSEPPAEGSGYGPPAENSGYVSSAEDDENAQSLLIRVVFSGVSLLLTGDIGFPGEREILAQYGADSHLLETDILKVGHHGSRTSTGLEFLRAVNPSVAVIQAGKNNFGHPHPEILEKLEKADIMLYRTDQNGAVLFRLKQGEISIRTMLVEN